MKVDDGTLDVVVVGGGAAGLSGGLVLARSCRRVVVVDSGSPRNAPASGVHALLGLDGVAPLELVRRGREEVRSYGGIVEEGCVVAAHPVASDMGLRFRVLLEDSSAFEARRLLVATGLRDRLPALPGLAQHWGHSVVHCPYCHGREVRDRTIGVIASDPGSVHHGLLFRQLTEDLVDFSQGHPLAPSDEARFAARGIVVEDTPIVEVLSNVKGTLSGVLLEDGRVVGREVLAVGTAADVRREGLDGLGLEVEALADERGYRFMSDSLGRTSAPGVWVAGNASDLTAQVGAAGAAGTLAGAYINADLAIEDADADAAIRH